MDSDIDSLEAGEQASASRFEDTDAPSWLRNAIKKWSVRAYATLAWTFAYKWMFGSLPLPTATGKLNEAISSLGPTLALSLLGIAFCIAAVRGPIGFIWTALYTLFFPFLVPLLLLKFILGIFWPPIRLLARAFESVSRKRRWLWLSALQVAAIPYLCFLIIFGLRPWVIQAALFLLLGCTALLIVAMFAWALAPVRIVLGVGDRAIRWGVRRLGDIYFQHIPKIGHFTEKIDSQIASSVALAGTIRTRLESFAAFLLRPATAVLAFLIAFMSLFLVVVVSFGFQYLAIARLDSQAFSGVSAPSAWDTVFFSVTTMATVGVSDLRATTVSSQILVSVELFFGLAVVSLLALSFSTLHSADLQAARVMWKDTDDHIQSRFALWAAMLAGIKHLFACGFGDLLQEQFSQAPGFSAAEKWLIVLRNAGEGWKQAMPAIEAMLAQAMESPPHEESPPQPITG
jgi:hypothetical protein